MSLANAAVNLGSRIWRTSGLQKTGLSKFVDYITALPLPFGLSYEFGTLYGWNIHEKLHNLEPETVTFFKEHLHAGDVIADIGANIGYYTQLFSLLVGEGGTVVAFEPSPDAFGWLKKAVRGKKNVTLVNKGIYSKPDTLRLYSQRKGDPMGSVVYKRGTHVHEIPVISLRDYPKTFTWAKIDVEGAELEVLRGFASPIQAVLEVASGIQEEFGEGVKKYLSDIQLLGYEIYFIVAGGTIIKYDGTNLDQLDANIYIKPLAQV